MPAGSCARRRAGRTIPGRAAALALALLLPAPEPLAQELLDPREAIIRRQVRGLEERALTNPQGAAAAAGTVRRDVIREGRGVALTPELRRLERRLERLRQPLQEDPLPGPPVTASPGLPFSAAREPDPLPSFGDPLATARRLVTRAADGLADGRRAQARSDLAAAASMLELVPPGPPDPAAGLRLELDELTGRAAGGG